MKDVIIEVYSFLLQANVLVSAVLGYLVGKEIGGMFGNPTTIGIMFAVIAFSNAALISGMGLTVDRVRELLEEQVKLLQQQENRQKMQGTNKG